MKLKNIFKKTEKKSVKNNVQVLDKTQLAKVVGGGQDFNSARSNKEKGM
jgi:hypothetical protein